MRTTLPLVLGFAAGIVAVADLYVGHDSYRKVQEHLRDFGIILASVAFILGGINVVQVNFPKIRRREADWQYKIVLLVSAVVMGLTGIAWHEFGGVDEPGSVAKSQGAAGEGARMELRTSQRNALVIVNGEPPRRAWHDGTPEDIAQSPGSKPLTLPLVLDQPNTIKVFMPVTGYQEYSVEVKPAAGETVVVTTSLGQLWGQKGRVFTWFYDHVFFPCNATMFALLAFYIASAAFRAFRARNTESALLLGAAIFVMLGMVPIGRAISPIFPEIEEWIMNVINTTGRRAIIMGAALGAIATGLRVILGIERTHLGSE